MRHAPDTSRPAPGDYLETRLNGHVTVRWDARRNWATRGDWSRLLGNLSDVRQRERGLLFGPNVATHGDKVSSPIFRNGTLAVPDGFSHRTHGVARDPWVLTAEGVDGALVVDPGACAKERPAVTVAGASADCAMLAFAYRDQVAGLVHAGWQGASKDIVGNAARKLSRILGQTALSDVRVAAAPMAVEGYEFGADAFREKFAAVLGRYRISPADVACETPGYRQGTEAPAGGPKVHLRLWEIIRRVLESHGIVHVAPPPRDTLDPASGFPSHRRDTLAGKKGDPQRFMTSVTWRRGGEGA